MEEGRAGGRGRSLVYRFYEGIILYIYFISHAKGREKERESDNHSSMLRYVFFLLE